MVIAPVRSILDVSSSIPFIARVACGRTSLFINVASILWVATISPEEDEAGKLIIPDTLETVNGEVVA